MSRFIIWLLVITLFFSKSSSFAEPFVFGTLAFPRQGDLALVGGPPSNVGTQVGTYIVSSFPGSTLVGTQTLTASFLNTIDVVILNSASSFSSSTHTFLSTAEQSALLDFVKAGNGAIIAADGINPSAASTFSGIFGINSFRSTSSTGVIVDPLHPVAIGPFGTITNFTIDPIGSAHAFVSIGPYATVIGRSLNGAPSILGIAENAISPGSGRVVLFSDATEFGWSWLQRDGMILNTIQYVAVPESSTLMLCSITSLFVGLGPIARRRMASR